MNRYVVTLKSAAGTRMVTVAADGIINARVAALQLRKHGEQIIGAIPYESLNKVSCH